MHHPAVTRLYKYTALNARAIAALATEKLWFANPSTFNDPFDCMIPNHAVVHLERLQGRAFGPRYVGHQVAPTRRQRRQQAPLN